MTIDQPMFMSSAMAVRPFSSSIVPKARRSCARIMVLRQASFQGSKQLSRRDWRIYLWNGVEFMVEPKDEIDAANERAASRLAKTPTAIAARYDRRIGRLVIDLSSGLSISFKPHDAQGLEEAKPEQLHNIEISPSGLGLHFPALDADLYLPSLLEGFLGSRRWMAAQLGKAGGKATSDAKSAAVRANGKLGGRPKKVRVPDVA
ncbi:MAG: DUF2442 domain-containing protein [Syntrophobacteraceae bacterium]